MKNKIVIIIIVLLLCVASIIGVTVRFQGKNVEDIKNNGSNNIIDIPNENKNNDKIEDEIIEVENNKEETNKNKEEVKNETPKPEENDTPQKEEKPPIKEENNNQNESDVKEESKQEEIKDNKEEIKEEKVIVSSVREDEEIVSYKYGTKITTSTTYEINTFNDNTIEKIEIKRNSSYDKTTFNGTTEELKSEAIKLTNENKNIYNEILNYVNSYRQEVNKNPLGLDHSLSVAATIRALEMAYSSEIMDISHTRPNGTSCGTIFDDLKISWNIWGENIAGGYKNAKAVSEGWKNSKGHYENMINDDFGKIGIGMVNLNGDRYWVQLFTN